MIASTAATGTSLYIREAKPQPLSSSRLIVPSSPITPSANSIVNCASSPNTFPKPRGKFGVCTTRAAYPPIRVGGIHLATTYTSGPGLARRDRQSNLLNNLVIKGATRMGSISYPNQIHFQAAFIDVSADSDHASGSSTPTTVSRAIYFRGQFLPTKTMNSRFWEIKQDLVWEDK